MNKKCFLTFSFIGRVLLDIYQISDFDIGRIIYRLNICYFKLGEREFEYLTSFKR